MSEFDAMVAVHGYNPEGMEGGRDPVEVWEDRLEQAQITADLLEGFGADIAVAISGGGDYSGKTEAEIIAEYASREFPELMDSYEVHLEDESDDTAGNVEQLYEMAQDLETDTVFAVSSRDHSPRLLRDWNEFIDDEDVDMFVGGIGSSEPYTESGKSPFIVEGAAFEPFIDAFNEVWGVDPESYEEAAQDVAEILREYH